MTEERNEKTLCEKSMKMVVNIIKLSSFSIAKMTLAGATANPTTPKNITPDTDSDMVTDKLRQPQLRSEKLHKSSKPHSFLMQPGGGENESLMFHEGKKTGSDDGRFDAYIRKVHDKNRSNLREAHKLLPYIMPPPPKPIK